MNTKKWWYGVRVRVIIGLVFITTSILTAIAPPHVRILVFFAAVGVGLVVGAIFDVVERFVKEPSQENQGL